MRRAARAVLPGRVAAHVPGLDAREPPRPVELAALDGELARAEALFAISQDEAREFLAGFELVVPSDRPADPFSTEYRDWTWKLYEAISRRDDYTIANEASQFDLEAAKLRPYPYQTASPAIVGDDLVARGYLLRCIGDPRFRLTPPARIVEFGPGWGNLTMDLVGTGFDVTAVDVSDQFCALMRARCNRPEGLRVVQSDMLAFEPDAPFDAAVFFESFHHCSDHVAMLRKLQTIVAPAGVVFFAGEPVHDMPYPWGPRLDGLSLWSTRMFGWLELGFDRSYFHEALARTGWHGARRAIKRRGAGSADVIVATRATTR